MIRQGLRQIIYERGDIQNWHNRNIKILRSYYEQLYAYKLESPDMEKVLEK